MNFCYCQWLLLPSVPNLTAFSPYRRYVKVKHIMNQRVQTTRNTVKSTSRKGRGEWKKKKEEAKQATKKNNNEEKYDDDDEYTQEFIQ